MESILNAREWLAADGFTVADLLMANVLRVARVRSFGDPPATESYVTESPSALRSRRPMQTSLRTLLQQTERS